MATVTFSVPKRKGTDISISAGETPHQDFEVNFKTDKHDVLKNRDLPDQHPISSITGLTEALATFIFEQGVSSDVWQIEHNLNKYPAVSVVDSAGNEVIAEVTYNDLNNITITMQAAFKGKAYLN